MRLALLCTAAVTTLALAGVASAADGPTVHWNAGVATDYVDQGINMSPGDNPSFSLGASVESGKAYAGVQGRTVDNDAEDGAMTDIYAGYRWGVASLSMDSGVNYRAVSGGLGQDSYVQVYTAASHPLGSKAKVGGMIVYSPNETGASGSSVYGEVNGLYKVTNKLSVSAGYGQKSFDANSALDDYSTYNVGASYQLNKTLGVDVRYYDNDLDEAKFGRAAGDTVLASLTANF